MQGAAEAWASALHKKRLMDIFADIFYFIWIYLPCLRSLSKDPAGFTAQVLERLHGSLLDYLVAAAGAPASERLSALRKIAHQLLVRRPMLDLGFFNWKSPHVPSCMPSRPAAAESDHAPAAGADSITGQCSHWQTDAHPRQLGGCHARAVAHGRALAGRKAGQKPPAAPRPPTARASLCSALWQNLD